MEQVRTLLDLAHGSERLILRLFVTCGLRPGELFAIRFNDIEQAGQLRIDESVKRVGKGDELIGALRRQAAIALWSCLPT